MKIRLGNDVRVRATLKGSDTYDYNNKNIKQIRSYFVNTTYVNKSDEPAVAILKPYPQGPFPQYYQTSPYTMKECGDPNYHIDPYNATQYINNDPRCGNYHCFPEYNGFGTSPCHFRDCNRQPIGMQPDAMSFDGNLTYMADSKLGDAENTIESIFQATSQLYVGTYKMIVVLTVFESGWGNNNLHTYTIDYGELFELVDDETGLSGNITINADSNTMVGDTVKAIDPMFASISAYVGTTVKIGAVDSDSYKYGFNVTLSEGATVVYNPSNWNYDQICFKSSNTSITVNQDTGELTINNMNNTQTVITAYAKSDNRIYATVIVRIKQVIMGYWIESTDTFDNIKESLLAGTYDSGRIHAINKADQGFNIYEESVHNDDTHIIMILDESKTITGFSSLGSWTVQKESGASILYKDTLYSNIYDASNRITVGETLESQIDSDQTLTIKFS